MGRAPLNGSTGSDKCLSDNLSAEHSLPACLRIMSAKQIILEAFKIAEQFSGRTQIHTYVDQNRAGDHICYYSDLRKMRAHYPAWDITQSLEETIRQIVESWRNRRNS